MKALLKTSLTAALIMISTVASQAITIVGTDTSHYVGRVVNGAPSSSANQLIYINILTGLSAPETFLASDPLNPTSETFYRSSNVFASLPTAVALGSISDIAPAASYSFGAYNYFYVKTGQDAHVFYIGGLSGPFSVNSTITDTSHVAFYNPGGPGGGGGGRVPDGGTTIALLGVSLLGLGSARKFLSKKA